MLLIALLSSFMFTSASPANAQARSANYCSTSNLRAWNMGGGVPWDRNYVIDVYGITRGDGHFIYYDPAAGGWIGIKWDAQNLINNNHDIRFGVSTAWAYAHPWWDVTSWRYIYPC